MIFIFSIVLILIIAFSPRKGKNKEADYDPNETVYYKSKKVKNVNLILWYIKKIFS